MPLLSISNLDVSYGAIHALHDLNVEIHPGEIVALIGSNGAGKTTLLRTISGLLQPRRGSIRWSPDDSSNEELVGQRPHQIVNLGVTHVPEGRQIFAHLTVRENLLLGAYQRNDKKAVQADIDRHFATFPILRERSSQRAGTLSGGEQQMLAIARALMSQPKLLLLDEPSLGLAPLIVKKIFEIIKEINAGGTTIFLVEQNAHLALNIAHRAYVLQTGHVIKSDDAKKLADDPEVKKAYLGG